MIMEFSQKNLVKLDIFLRFYNSPGEESRLADLIRGLAPQLEECDRSDSSNRVPCNDKSNRPHPEEEEVRFKAKTKLDLRFL